MSQPFHAQSAHGVGAVTGEAQVEGPIDDINQGAILDDDWPGLLGTMSGALASNSSWTEPVMRPGIFQG